MNERITNILCAITILSMVSILFLTIAGIQTQQQINDLSSQVKCLQEQVDVLTQP